MDFITRFKNALFLILVLLAQAIALAMQVRTPADTGEPDGRSVRLLRMWATATVTPFERAAHAVGWGVHNGWGNYVDLRHVRQQNRDLQQQLTRMRIEQAAIAEDALEGRRLQALLAFKEKYVGSTVAAQVIGASGSDQTHVLTIDKGFNDGLRPDMAVITPDGIVGKLRDVFPSTAQVLEINDQTSGAGVILASTRIRAILRGTVAGRAQIGNLTSDSRIKPGEQVLSSGGDQVYPRGLPVGTIESIAPDPDHQPYTAIVVHPAVNLDRVEEVLVITGTQSDLPPGTQQDLSTAEAQHAADLSAERLPGLHDDEPAAPAATDPANPAAPAAPTTPPVATIPHPAPSMHPDRYTSGTTPSAADLTPGGANSAPATIPAQENPPTTKPSTGDAPAAKKLAPTKPPAPPN
jgi:rod shape-determining protein MreC